MKIKEKLSPCHSGRTYYRMNKKSYRVKPDSGGKVLLVDYELENEITTKMTGSMSFFGHIEEEEADEDGNKEKPDEVYDLKGEGKKTESKKTFTFKSTEEIPPRFAGEKKIKQTIELHYKDGVIAPKL